jgi:hypothetical protein
MHAGVQLDLFLAQPDNWGLTLLVRTGSAAFSTAMLVVGPHFRTPQSLSSWSDLKRYSERAILEGAGEPRAAEEDSGHDTCWRRANHA